MELSSVKGYATSEMSGITTEDITLDQYNKVSEIYSRYGHSDSAHSFESMYMWKTDMGISLYTGSDVYAAKADKDHGEAWFFPVGSQEGKISFINELLEQNEPFRFRYVTQEDIRFLNKSFPDRFQIVPMSSDSEYVISRQTLIELPGHHFVKDRGRIRKLCKEHDIRTIDIHDAGVEDILEVSSLWDEKKKNLQEVIDHTATRTLINSFEKFDVHGVVLYMDGSMCAVIAGFVLDDKTIDCCLQKTSKQIQGLTCLLQQEFAKALPDSFKLLNWEEDLGIEGLRHAKEHMKPEYMISMYAGYSK